MCRCEGCGFQQFSLGWGIEMRKFWSRMGIIFQETDQLLGEFSLG